MLSRPSMSGVVCILPLLYSAILFVISSSSEFFISTAPFGRDAIKLCQMGLKKGIIENL